ncbi:MAG: response regulator transcription factor [Clostridiales bacterium]|nr:response regulator transcription factor [Clostridiales bacterium]
MYEILVVEDDLEIAAANEKYLKAKGFSVILAHDGKSAVEALERHQFDCIVLDVLLPDCNGIRLCSEIRKKINTPILFLSCLGDQEHVLQGIISGGDDYLSKPFSFEELEIRILAKIRRNIDYNFRLDVKNYALLTPVGTIKFSHQEFDLLLMLLEADKLITESDFQNKPYSSSNSLAVYIRRLRKKLAPVKQWIGPIETVYAQGYKMHKKVPLLYKDEG